MSAIVFKNLAKTYQKNGTSFEALKVLHSQLKRESFRTSWPNGAGKTSLISILAGLNDPSGGSVEVFGRNIKQDPSYVKLNLGIVPQELVFDPFFLSLRL